MVLGSKATSSSSSLNEISSLEDSNRGRNISIEDLKNINRTLMRSGRDFPHSNESDVDDDDQISAVQEINIDNNSYDNDFCQLELRGKLSSISTIEDLSLKVKSKMERVTQREHQITSNVETKISVIMELTFQIKIKSLALRHN